MTSWQAALHISVKLSLTKTVRFEMSSQCWHSVLIVIVPALEMSQRVKCDIAATWKGNIIIPTQNITKTNQSKTTGIAVVSYMG